MVAIRDPKTFYFNFDWPKGADNNLKHKIEFIKQKTRLNNCWPNISMETILLNTKSSKTNESRKFVLNLSQRFDLGSSNKHVALKNLSTYYRWKNIRKQYKNNKLKIIAPTWNDEFKLLDGSYSASDRVHHKKHEILTTIPPIHVYISYKCLK